MATNVQSQGKMVASNKRIRVGPWGGAGGAPWDDGGGYNGVRSITVTYGLFINSIRVQYDKNGWPVLGEKHGGTEGSYTTVTEQIDLDFPSEFLTTVSGYYCPVVSGGSPVIRSLAFKTNRRTYGPFGVEEGTPFTYPMDGGVVVGFHGRSAWYLEAIGLYVSVLRPETIWDKVHQLGFMAYRSLLSGSHGQQQQHQNANVQKQ